MLLLGGKEGEGPGRASGCPAGSGPACSAVDGREAWRWRHVPACGHRWQRVTTGLSGASPPLPLLHHDLSQADACVPAPAAHARAGKHPNSCDRWQHACEGDTAPRPPLAPGLGHLVPQLPLHLWRGALTAVVCVTRPHRPCDAVIFLPLCWDVCGSKFISLALSRITTLASKAPAGLGSTSGVPAPCDLVPCLMAHAPPCSPWEDVTPSGGPRGNRSLPQWPPEESCTFRR